MKVSLPLYLFYYFAKAIVWVSTRLFYRRIEVINTENIKMDQPTIIVSNHPSTLLDPLNTAVNMPRMLFFVANAGLFQTAFNKWFFTTFYCIPIERKQDVDGRPIQNENSFALCDNHLATGGCLYMAPEGVSFPEQRLRPLRTGMARIALSAEEHNAWDLGLKIIPIGLVYSSSTKFRADVLVTIGEPISVADYQKIHQKDARKCVRALTNETEEGFDKILLNTTDFEEERLLLFLAELAQNDVPVNLATKFTRTKKQLVDLRKMAANEPEKRKKLEQTTWEYARLLRQNKLLDAAVLHSKGAFFDFLLLLFSAPFAILGFLNHFLPFTLIDKINKKYNNDLSYHSTYKYMGGLVFLPLFYWLQTKLFGVFVADDKLIWAYILLLIPSGIFAEWYGKKWKHWRAKNRFNSLENILKTKIIRLRNDVRKIVPLSKKQ